MVGQELKMPNSGFSHNQWPINTRELSLVILMASVALECQASWLSNGKDARMRADAHNESLLSCASLIEESAASTPYASCPEAIHELRSGSGSGKHLAPLPQVRMRKRYSWTPDSPTDWDLLSSTDSLSIQSGSRMELFPSP